MANAEDDPGSRPEREGHEIAAFQAAFRRHPPRDFRFGRLWRRDLQAQLFEHSFTVRMVFAAGFPPIEVRSRINHLKSSFQRLRLEPTVFPLHSGQRKPDYSCLLQIN